MQPPQPDALHDPAPAPPETDGKEERGDPTWGRLSEQLAYYSRASRAAKQAYQRLKVAELAVGAAVPVVAALQAPAPLTAVLAALVVIAEGVQQLYGWQTNAVLYRSTAEALKHEKFLFLAGASPYDAADRRHVLAGRVEQLVATEHTRWAETRRTTNREQGGAVTPAK